MIIKKEIKKNGFNKLQKFFLLVFLFIFTGALPFMAAGDEVRSTLPLRLTLNDAKEMAKENNTDLQIAKTSLEIAQNSLEVLNEQIDGIDGQEDEIEEFLILQKERRDELEHEINVLEEQEEEIINDIEELAQQISEIEEVAEIMEIIQEIEELQDELARLIEEENNREDVREILQEIEDLQEELAASIENGLTIEEIIEINRQIVDLQLELLLLMAEGENIDEIQSITEQIQSKQEELLILLEDIEDIEESQSIMEEIGVLQEDLVNVQSQLAPLRIELAQVEATINATQMAYDNYDLIIEQARLQLEEANQQLQLAEEMLESQEELLMLGVEALFTVSLIIKDQFPLQEQGYELVSDLLKAEELKEDSGYSSMLQVIELESQLMDVDRAGDMLNSAYIEIVDQLCLLIGIRPGTKLNLVSFAPEDIKRVNLEDSLQLALDNGALMSARRENLEMRKRELKDLEEQFGDEEDFDDSLMKQQADLRIELAEQELKQAEHQTYAEVRRSYFALKESEKEIYRCEQSIQQGLIQQEAIKAAFEAGYSTASESAAGSLNIIKKEAEYLSARYQYHLKLREFELVERGYIVSSLGGASSLNDLSGLSGQSDFSGSGFSQPSFSQSGFSQNGHSSFSSEIYTLDF